MDVLEIVVCDATNVISDSVEDESGGHKGGILIWTNFDQIW